MFWQRLHTLRLLAAVAACCLLAAAVQAQGVSAEVPNPLAGQHVGIYLAKRQMRIAEPFHIPFAAFVQAQDSLGLVEEDLKTALAIKLGEYLTGHLTADLSAASAYYINANPDLARATIGAWDGSNLDVAAMRAVLPGGTTRILVIDRLQFATRTQRGMVMYNNRLITDSKQVRQVRMLLYLADAATGRQLAAADVTWDDTQSAPELVQLKPGKGAGEQLLAKVFGYAFLCLFFSS